MLFRSEQTLAMQASSEEIAHWRAGDSHMESFDGTEQPAKRRTMQLASMRSDSSSCAVFFFFFLGLDVGEGLGSLLVACAATSTSAKPASSSSSSIFTFFFLFFLFTASSRVATRALASLRSFSRFDFSEVRVARGPAQREGYECFLDGHWINVC